MPKFSCSRPRFSLKNAGGSHVKRTRFWKAPSAEATSHPPATTPARSSHGTPTVPMHAAAAPRHPCPAPAP
ncbi:hypothetical protein ACLESO_39650 [Pyxidicoccus sp. 3LG]